LQDKIITPLYRLRELTQTLVMAPNNQIRKKIEYNLNDAIQLLEKEFKIIDLENKNLLKDWFLYKNLINDTINYLDDEFEEGAYVNVTTVSRTQFHKLLEELLKVQSKFLNNSTIAYTDASKESKQVKLEIMIIIITVLILSTIIGWLIANNIINSIHTVQRGLGDFFEYLNHKKIDLKKIEIASEDEFYQMAGMINENVSNIQRNIEENELLIKNATKVLEEIKGGNLGSRLTTNSNHDTLNELKMMMNNMIDNLEFKIQDEISKRLEQEQILIQQTKLASMGEMIGNIAHQWRQPLAQISAIHMNMKVTYDFNKFTEKYLKLKLKEANTLTSYMSQTITDFQNFFKPQGEKEKFSIEKACRDAYFIVDSSLTYHNIHTTIDVIEDSYVFGYKNEYSQVILNILSNAKDILIERKIKKPEIGIQIKAGDSFAIIKIQDNAGGVDQNIIDKIFDPYFTTRYKTQGTGIGLYMSKNIIETNMNGFINVKNKYDGALFTIKVDLMKNKNIFLDESENIKEK
jgi:two-component system C4-dicarboxylate transport sensor histidine kinase DctB